MPEGTSSDRIPTKVTLDIRPRTNQEIVCFAPGASFLVKSDHSMFIEDITIFLLFGNDLVSKAVAAG